MKGFLFDENIPYQITFTPSLPVIHSTDLGISVSDSVLWDYARAKELVIVTKDTDFSNRILLTVPPPWVIHLRIGNMCKQDFHSFLARVWSEIEALLPVHKLINVFADRIEAVR